MQCQCLELEKNLYNQLMNNELKPSFFSFFTFLFGFLSKDQESSRKDGLKLNLIGEIKFKVWCNWINRRGKP